jgi:hypothetical protein
MKTILFINQEELERYYLIEENVITPTWSEYEINEYIMDLNTRIYTHRQNSLTNKEGRALSVTRFIEEKIELGYIKIPNEQYEFDEQIGVLTKEEKGFSIQKYLPMINRTARVFFDESPISDYSKNLYLEMMRRQTEIKEALIDAISQDYDELKDQFNQYMPEGSLDIIPPLSSKEDVLKILNPISVLIADEKVLTEKPEIRFEFKIGGFTRWDIEHPFELDFIREGNGFRVINRAY